MTVETDVPYFTPKVCRYCRHWYVSPKGSRWPGCRQCCPQLDDRPVEPPPLVFDPDGMPLSMTYYPDDGIPF